MRPPCWTAPVDLDRRATFALATGSAARNKRKQIRRDTNRAAAAPVIPNCRTNVQLEFDPHGPAQLAGLRPQITTASIMRRRGCSLSAPSQNGMENEMSCGASAQCSSRSFRLSGLGATSIGRQRRWIRGPPPMGGGSAATAFVQEPHDTSRDVAYLTESCATFGPVDAKGSLNRRKAVIRFPLLFWGLAVRCLVFFDAYRQKQPEREGGLIPSAIMLSREVDPNPHLPIWTAARNLLTTNWHATATPDADACHGWSTYKRSTAEVYRDCRKSVAGIAVLSDADPFMA